MLMSIGRTEDKIALLVHEVNTQCIIYVHGVKSIEAAGIKLHCCMYQKKPGGSALCVVALNCNENIQITLILWLCREIEKEIDINIFQYCKWMKFELCCSRKREINQCTE